MASKNSPSYKYPWVLIGILSFILFPASPVPAQSLWSRLGTKISTGPKLIWRHGQSVRGLSQGIKGTKNANRDWKWNWNGRKENKYSFNSNPFNKRYAFILGAASLLGTSLLEKGPAQNCPSGLKNMAENYGAEFLIHRTPCENIESLLASKELRPGAKMGKNNFDYQYQSQASQFVYLSLSNSKTESSPFHPEIKKQCALIFSMDILDEFIGSYHVAKGWLYGNKYQDFHAESDDPEGIRGIFEKITQDLQGMWGQNELVFTRPIPLKYLIKIEQPMKNGAI